jgi:quercetin 2,3-dioxygenase
VNDAPAGTGRTRLPADSVDSQILQQVALGSQWPALDPFLFCAHHQDAYPQGNDACGPDGSLAGRDLGSDFAGRDGWRMYHGTVVPGFPQHPHRGFETVTYVRNGLVDHADSTGATARFGGGDVQWLTAGKGIVHSEMFPLLHRDQPNPVELFQIWLNLAPPDKLVDPYFAMMWNDDIPRRRVVAASGAIAEITVIAGQLDGVVAPSPPPNSWASKPASEVAIWHLRFEPGASFTMPATRHEDTVRTLYVFAGTTLQIGPDELDVDTGAVVRCDRPVALGSASGAECLVLQGRPIGKPVAQYGPFVMNTAAEISQAFDDYRQTGFGGWPWSTDGPVHGRVDGRFASREGASREFPGPTR